MKFIDGIGTGEILFTSPITLIEKCGRVCYQSEKGPITQDTAKRFIKNRIMKAGHHSVLEHSLMTVVFDNICRGFTHEQVRHRLTAISQESTRYVDEGDFIIVPPPDYDLEAEVIDLFEAPENENNMPVKVSLKQWFKMNEMVYRSLRKNGLPTEDARQTLPIAIKSQIAISANYRQWRHIFSMRCEKHAHWEIRRTMCELLDNSKKLVPVIFDDMVFGGTYKHNTPFYVKTGEYKDPGMSIVTTELPIVDESQINLFKE